MTYQVKFHPAFVAEWKRLPMALKECVGEILDHLEEEGPFLGRPDVDTLKGSKHRTMKEIRARSGREVWRFAFAFDPDQAAIILCGGGKQGMNQTLFYRQLIDTADERFSEWLREKNR